MKKLIALLLVLIMIFAVVACNDVVTPQGDAADNNAGNTEPGEEQKIVPTALKIKGADISEYTIVYAYNPSRAKYQQYSSLVTQDTEYDKQTAENLAALIKTHFGATVKVVRDGEQTTGAKEIVIGVTNRGLVDTTIAAFTSDKDYRVREANGKIVICGKTYGATWHAAEDFITDVLSQNTETAVVESGYNLRAKANMVIVGCIGDSLTNGSTSSQGDSQGNINSSDVSLRREIVAYPAVLQRIAWKDMVVYNYGLGGRTMINPFVWTDGSDHAWVKCDQYQLCMNNAPNIDLALIMLGTNDANKNRAEQAGYTFGRNASYKAAFKSGCQRIVNDLKAKNSNMKIALLNCPKAYNESENNMVSVIRPFQKDIAKDLGIIHLDMYKETMRNMPGSDYPDGLHPNDKGYTKYAEIIYGLITPTTNEILGK